MKFYRYNEASLEAALWTLRTGTMHELRGHADNWEVYRGENLASQIDLDAMMQRIRRLAKGE